MNRDQPAQPDVHASSTGQALTGADWLDVHFEAERPEYEAMVDSVGIRPGWHVLDAGCGGGSFLPLIAQAVGLTGRVTAFDLTPDNVAAVEVARLRPKPGQEQGVIEYVEYWTRERKPQIPGVVGGYVYRLENDPGAWLFAVAFRDRESYRANAESAAMDADYRRLRALLVESPVWEDGEIVGQF